MLFGEIINVALGAIRTNKLRSFLTMLGIVIGVAAVITMVALGTGAQKAVQDQIEALGTNLLSVYAGQSMHRGIARADRVSLTTDDATALARDAQGLTAVIPELRRSQQVEYGSRNINVNIMGTVPEFVPVNNYEVATGRMFTAGDASTRKRVAVLGYAVPEMLDANGAAMIGQQIMIRGIPFEIIGVLDEKGSTSSWFNPDEQILVPLQTAQHRIFGSDRVNSITVQVGHPDSLAVAMIEIERVLRREHALAPGKDNDFQIRNRAEFLATFEETTQAFTFLLGGIAAVSLLVGGIGIMNIMLVSVTERTREIGVRKAMGATRHNIMMQFLVEALVLCMLGGVLGIMVGSSGAVALSELANWNTFVSPGAILLAFAFSAAVGVFFGLWPARRAAALDPIEALRYE
ncbi:MAG: FtsX-like permease family protein [Gemmatimonadales bacterium]|nr:FtsX-like permease family protein [Gemmatimonadales bacterium]NIN10650.1 FtsX-like permease family protein [Gemmatimonadales bacterium]NIN49412.1 FtsX-like permease family protein [Gemmatimonadales bacterium]NIP06876.1 FtsX-like permease family protein [Gemmatimonadales bacterium]NIR01550.1 FtsX-like permease family protein [Gemmatimonadales bacterium]